MHVVLPAKACPGWWQYSFFESCLKAEKHLNTTKLSLLEVSITGHNIHPVRESWSETCFQYTDEKLQTLRNSQNGTLLQNTWASSGSFFQCNSRNFSEGLPDLHPKRKSKSKKCWENTVIIFTDPMKDMCLAGLTVTPGKFNLLRIWGVTFGACLLTSLTDVSELLFAAPCPRSLPPPLPVQEIISTIFSYSLWQQVYKCMSA